LVLKAGYIVYQIGWYKQVFSLKLTLKKLADAVLSFSIKTQKNAHFNSEKCRHRGEG